jgi:hypothetical protein
VDDLGSQAHSLGGVFHGATCTGEVAAGEHIEAIAEHVTLGLAGGGYGLCRDAPSFHERDEPDPLDVECVEPVTRTGEQAEGLPVPQGVGCCGGGLGQLVDG